MTVAHQTTRCPYCREPIAAGAVRCKHCHADLTTGGRRKVSRLSNLNTFRMGFLIGLLFSLILAILLYLQFFASD